MARVDHLEELELQGREGGQRAADAGGQEGRSARLSGAVAAERGDEVAEQQGAGHVDGEGRPGPGGGPVRRRLRQADAGEGADHAAGVDRRQAAGVESGPATSSGTLVAPTAGIGLRRADRAGRELARREGAIEEVVGRRLFVQRREGDGPAAALPARLPVELLRLARRCSSAAARQAPRSPSTASASASPRSRADHVYTLAWQADAAEELVRRAGSPPVFVVAHDMGTSVATELMARDLARRARDGPRAGRCSSTAACCSTWRSRRSGRNCCAAGSGRSSPAADHGAGLPRPVLARSSPPSTR